ncbi:MAG: hypothetical protein V2J51_15280 [Erythrobacter sp.]|jgi:hypothetical protein|nr:hypothetical protein [Erythrobacter sp.]
MSFDMGKAWSHAVDMVRENFQLLAVLAGIFLLLPTVATYLLFPEFRSLMEPGLTQEQTMALVEANALPITIISLVAAALQFAGYGAIIALVGRARPTVGQAIATGIRIVPSTFAILIAFIFIYILLAALVVLPFALLGSLLGAAALGVFAVPLVLLAVVWLMARLSMSMPALVLDISLNPFRAMGRSFRLTRAVQWRLVAFWGILIVTFTIITLLVTGVFGVIAALIGDGTTSALVLGLVNGFIQAIFGMMICALAVAIYQQLAGTGPGGMAQTFE